MKGSGFGSRSGKWISVGTEVGPANRSGVDRANLGFEINGLGAAVLAVEIAPEHQVGRRLLYGRKVCAIHLDHAPYATFIVRQRQDMGGSDLDFSAVGWQLESGI